jgi:hypothetical protein
MIDFSAAMRTDQGTAPPPAPVNQFDLELVRDRLAIYTDEIERMLESVEAISVTDEISSQGATELGVKAKKIDTAIERVRKELVQAPNDYIRDVNGFAKSFQAKLQAIQASVRGKLGQYAAKQELERRKAEEAARKAQAEAQAKLDAEAKAANVEPVQIAAPAIPKAQNVVRSASGGSATQKKVWKFEVTDAAMVPREYLVVNESLVRQHVANGVREIPGVRIYEDIQIALKG